LGEKVILGLFYKLPLPLLPPQISQSLLPGENQIINEQQRVKGAGLRGQGLHFTEQTDKDQLITE